MFRGFLALLFVVVSSYAAAEENSCYSRRYGWVPDGFSYCTVDILVVCEDSVWVRYENATECR